MESNRIPPGPGIVSLAEMSQVFLNLQTRYYVENIDQRNALLDYLKAHGIKRKQRPWYKRKMDKAKDWLGEILLRWANALGAYNDSDY